MNSILDVLSQPWPWYVAGPLIGLTVPILLIMGNKSFGISSNLRHICAACLPSKVPFFQYDWRKEAWNLFFASGIIVGGFLAATVLTPSKEIMVHDNLRQELRSYGVTEINSLIPGQLFSFENLATPEGLILMVVGGFLVGFGTRYAGGCTSGHSIMGLSTLQVPSLIATCCFMAGGIIMANFILPLILNPK